MTHTTASTTATRNQRLTKQNLDLMNVNQELRNELILNKKENDELRQEINRLQTLLNNRHLLIG
jgi:hypothetical protein